MRYLAMLSDTLFTQVEVGQSDVKSEAWAISLKAAIQARKDKQLSIHGLVQKLPLVYDTIKKISLYDEKYFVEALSQN